MVVDLWQVSHAAVVCTWSAGLPSAVDPLWQAGAAPGDTRVVQRRTQERSGRFMASLTGRRGFYVSTWLPGAVDPLWQLAQPLVMPVWLNLRTSKRCGRFMTGFTSRSRFYVVSLICQAVEPLWQVAQPLVMPVWLNVAPANDVVDLWQVSQTAVVCT